MASFNCSPYDRGKLIRVLDYALEKKKEDRLNEIITKEMYDYDSETIRSLIEMLNGNSKYAGYYAMSKLGREKFSEPKKSRKEDDCFWKN